MKKTFESPSPHLETGRSDDYPVIIRCREVARLPGYGLGGSALLLESSITNLILYLSFPLQQSPEEIETVAVTLQFPHLACRAIFPPQLLGFE